MGNTWVFPSFSHSMGKYSKIHQIERAWEIGTHVFPKVWYFSYIRFPFYGILYHMRNAWLFPSISNSTGKCSKIHPVRFQIVFPQYYCFYLFQNLLTPQKSKQRKLIR